MLGDHPEWYRQMNALQRKIGPLEVIQIPGKTPAPVFIFLHGYGANAADLLGLHQRLKDPPDSTWIFPEGPLDLAADFGGSAHAWWHIDHQALMEAQLSERLDFSQKIPDGLKEARQMVQSMISELGYPMSHIFLGGFSQGAILACDVTLHSLESPQGLIVLSGTLINSKVWCEAASKHAGLRFFQSHGTLDPLLSIQGAQSLEDLLKTAGCKGNLLKFSGGHEIPESVMVALSDFIVARPGS